MSIIYIYIKLKYQTFNMKSETSILRTEVSKMEDELFSNIEHQVSHGIAVEDIDDGDDHDDVIIRLLHEATLVCE